MGAEELCSQVFLKAVFFREFSNRNEETVDPQRRGQVMLPLGRLNTSQNGQSGDMTIFEMLWFLMEVKVDVYLDTRYFGVSYTLCHVLLIDGYPKASKSSNRDIDAPSLQNMKIWRIGRVRIILHRTEAATALLLAQRYEIRMEYDVWNRRKSEAMATFKVKLSRE